MKSIIQPVSGPIALDLVEVLPKQVVAEVRAIVTKESPPLIKIDESKQDGPPTAGPSSAAAKTNSSSLLKDKEGLKILFDRLFEQVRLEFKTEFAENPDFPKTLNKGGALNEYVERSLKIYHPNDVRLLFSSLNEFFGAIRPFDIETRRNALGGVLNMSPDELRCNRGMAERIQQILGPLLPGNRVLKDTYYNSRNQHFARLGMRVLPVHGVANFDAAAAGLPSIAPLGRPDHWVNAELKHDVEIAIGGYLTGGFKKVLDGFDDLFKDKHTPPNADAVRAFQEQHLDELSYFMIPGVRLDQSEQYLPVDLDGAYVYNRTRIICAMAEKILPVLTLDSKINLVKHNPELIAIPKLALDVMTAQPNTYQKLAAAMPDQTKDTIRDAINRKDDTTQENVLHRLQRQGIPAAPLLAGEFLDIRLAFQSDAGGRTPLDGMIENNNIVDLLAVALRCETTQTDVDQLKEILAKYINSKGNVSAPALQTLAQNEDFVERCKGINDPMKSVGLMNLAFSTPLGKQFVLDNLDNLAKFDAAQINALSTALAPSDGAPPVSARLQNFVKGNLSLLKQLKDPRQITATCWAVESGAAREKFIRNNAPRWATLTAIGMESYVRLLSKKNWHAGAVRTGFDGVKFVEKHLDRLQSLDDSQISETAKLFIRDPGYLDLYAGRWLKLDATQMFWTNEGLSRNRFLNRDDDHNWLKLSAIQMMKLVQGIDAEPARDSLGVSRFDDVRKFSPLQMQHTLDMVRRYAGRQFIDQHFDTWKTFGPSAMKATLDVYKAGMPWGQFGAWTNLPEAHKGVLGGLAAKGVGWNVIRDTFLTADGSQLVDDVARFLNDDAYRNVALRDPQILTSDERKKALLDACKKNPAFKAALVGADLISGLNAEQIELTEKMFSLKGAGVKRSDPEGSKAAAKASSDEDYGAQFVRGNRWKTFSAQKMEYLLMVFQVPSLAKKIVEDPVKADDY